MGLELTTDRYPPITGQTRYPLRHAASYGGIELYIIVIAVIAAVVVLVVLIIIWCCIVHKKTQQRKLRYMNLKITIAESENMYLVWSTSVSRYAPSLTVHVYMV